MTLTAKRRQVLASGFGWAAGLLLPGCTTTGWVSSHPAAAPRPGATEPDLVTLLDTRSLRYLLLGEVHDSRIQHRMRLGWLQHLAAQPGLATRYRVSLAFEQLDAIHQPALDAFQARLNDQARQAPGTARALAESGRFNFSGWDWPLYEPVVQLALRERWRIVGVNLAAAEVMKIARDPKAAPLPAALGWSVADEQAMQAEIQSGHCNALPPQAVAPMARAQMARDEHMAKALNAALRHGEAGPAQSLVILLAGNVHVRRDLGVPRHLKVLDQAAGIYSIGLLEQDDAGGVSAQAYDQVVLTAAQSREDPCVAFKVRMGSVGEKR